MYINLSTKVEVFCDFCGASIFRKKKQIYTKNVRRYAHIFCDNNCQGAFRRAEKKRIIFLAGEKKCGLCSKVKPLSKFNKNNSNSDGLNNICQECSKQVSKKYYLKNSDKHKKAVYDRNIQLKHRNAIYVYNILKKSKCKDCGESNPIVLEFDHLLPENKSFDISFGIARLYGLEKLQKEIDKCEIVCANCHRIRTAHQFKWSILKMIKNDSDVA